MTPFISQSNLTEIASEGTEDLQGDTLTINGTIASLWFPTNATETAGAQTLRIVAGDWLMTVNDTAVSGFRSNFTVVTADGLGRNNYSITEFVPVNSSSVEFDSNVIVITSSAAIRPHLGDETVNLVITLESLNTLRLDLNDAVGGNVTSPIYGIVENMIISDDGVPTRVISR
jgi:hypothetical protein